MGSSSDGTLRKLCFILLGLAVIANSCVCYSVDSCDWNGSGLSSIPSQNEEERGVQPLYLRCRQGRIRWSYPTGALRLLLRLQGPGKEFRACIRAAPRFQGARLYLEGHRRLHLLYSPDSDNEVSSTDRKMRCFTSVKGQVALYVEALPATLQSSKKAVAQFTYDLRPLGRGAHYDDMEDCRPCTDEEIIQEYCSSDYVMMGTVPTLSHDASQDRTELQVRVSSVLRDSPSRSVLSSSHEGDDSFVQKARLYRPLKCDTKVGTGQFLFIAQTLLGDPYVTCAPRIAQWKVIRRKAIEEGSSPCLLD